MYFIVINLRKIPQISHFEVKKVRKTVTTILRFHSKIDGNNITNVYEAKLFLILDFVKNGIRLSQAYLRRKVRILSLG